MNSIIEQAKKILDGAPTENQYIRDQLSDLIKLMEEERNNWEFWSHKVKDMRQAQNAYFAESKKKLRNFVEMNRLLKISKAIEGEVDLKTVEIINKCVQAKMF